MRKMTSIVCALLLVFALGACGNGGGAESIVYEATPESLSQFFENYNKIKCEDLSVEMSNGDKTCKVKFKNASSAWDETSFTREQLTAYIDFCKTAYSVGEINEVIWQSLVDMTDARGNEKTETGITIDMKKDKFSQYDWDNMSYKSGTFTQIENDCDIFNVHAGIAKNVSYDKVFYAG